MTTPWEALSRLTTDAREVLIAAPYLKADTLEQLLAMLDDDVALTCITRWKREDIAAGASDVSCCSLVIERGGEFLLHPRLHAKFYRFGSQTLVGSANLTGAGTGLRTPANLEILCEPGPSFDAVAFERSLRNESSPVNASDLALWAAIERLPPSIAASRPPPPDASSEWRPATRDPEHVWLAYGGLDDRIVSPDERDMAERDLAAMSLPSGLGREDFEMWVRAELLSSAPISDVRRAEPMIEADAWTHLAEAWGTTKSEAQRFRETAQNWIAAFLPPNEVSS